MKKQSDAKKELAVDLEAMRRKIAKLEKEARERKRIGKLLQESELKLRAQYRHNPVPTITWQRRGDNFIIIDYNLAAEAFTDGLIVNFIGQGARSIYEDRPDIINDMWRCFQGQTVVKRETLYRMFTKGIERIIAFTFAFVPPDLVLSHMEDITQRKTMEDLLTRSGKELRALSSRLLTMTEQERKRVSRELHDSIGQYLTTIKFNTENALNQMFQEQYAAAASSLQAGIPLIRQTIEEIRRIMMDLRPSILDDLGIIATLSWFCREFQSVYTHIGIEKHIRLKEQQVPEALKVIIYRILQEAVNNAAKHSRADLIRIGLEINEGKLQLSIEDNGKGFNVRHAFDKAALQPRVGLISMRERAELSGGELTIRSRRGAGTAVLAVWPL